MNALLLLVQVVDAGSLAEAARRTGVPKSTLSRKLRELEESLGVRLLPRTSRRLGLTDAGLFDRLRRSASAGATALVDRIDDRRLLKRGYVVSARTVPIGAVRLARS